MTIQGKQRWPLIATSLLLLCAALKAPAQQALPIAESGGKLSPLDTPLQDFSKLPPPLDVVSGNVLDLESSGYFKIIKAEYHRTNVHADEALIWTLRVLKPITFRHAILDLSKWQDVRFYRTVTNRLTKQKRQLELAVRKLRYAPYLDEGAIDLEILEVDDTFDVWILLTEREIHSLVDQVADTIKFTRSGPDIRDRYRTLDNEHGNPWAR